MKDGNILDIYNNYNSNFSNIKFETNFAYFSCNYSKIFSLNKIMFVIDMTIISGNENQTFAKLDILSNNVKSIY